MISTRCATRRVLLVWHDMMFACALYPATPVFLSSVELEIRHQVKRLRHHPCIAPWRGYNEDVGALTWFPESRQNRDRYIVDYDRLNEGVIGRVVDECDPTRTFWPSSPSAGPRRLLRQLALRRAGGHALLERLARREALQRLLLGDAALLLGVRLPVLSLDAHHPFSRAADVTSPVMEHHQRHPGGNSAISEMLPAIPARRNSG